MIILPQLIDNVKKFLTFSYQKHFDTLGKKKNPDSLPETGIEPVRDLTPAGF